MKKILLSTAVMFVSGLIFTQAGSAQLINYERRNKNMQKNDASTPAAAAVNTARNQVRNIMDPEVVSRVEKIYDTNNDGRLQITELKEFYSDVIDNVNRRGSFRVTEGVLKQFDTNNDDRISSYEIGAIERAIQ